MLVRPDDEVYRVDAVWLGPRGMTLPWSARYTAYGIWLVLPVGILLVEAVLPMSLTDQDGSVKTHNPSPRPGQEGARGPKGAAGRRAASARREVAGSRLRVHDADRHAHRP